MLLKNMVLALLVFLAGAIGLEGQTATVPFGPMYNYIGIDCPPTPFDNWYGNTVGVDITFGLGLFTMFFECSNTYPWYNGTCYGGGSVSQTGPEAPSPVIYPLSQTNSYHNGMVYVRSLASSNGIRLGNMEYAKAKNVKEGGDPLLGKSAGSMSFWQWLQLGQMSLKLYGKTASIVRALHSGTVNIDVWKLIPKIAVMNEDDPAAPALVMGLVPSSRGAIQLAKDITNFSDPRYNMGNLIRFDDLNNLVPSLAVKPSFYGAYAHLPNTGPQAQNQLLVNKVAQTFHELRIGLSELKRRAMGRSHTEADIERSRFSTAWARNYSRDLQANASSWDDVYSELSTGSKFFGNGFASDVRTMAGEYTHMKGAEINAIENSLEVKAGDTWKAKRLAGNINNISAALETQEYLEGAKKVEDLVVQYASQDGNHGQYDDQKVQLGLAVGDAWTNKLINDELRALRQLYGMQVQREAIDRLAPYIALSQCEMVSAASRLARLQNYLTQLQQAQQASTAFFQPSDLARVITRMTP